MPVDKYLEKLKVVTEANRNKVKICFAPLVTTKSPTIGITIKKKRGRRRRTRWSLQEEAKGFGKKPSEEFHPKTYGPLLLPEDQMLKPQGNYF